MPRYLYLLRHAQSAERQQGQTDFDRELTPTGIQQAYQVGRFFSDQKTFPEIIHSSRALRARSTATLIGDVLKFEADQLFFHEELYEASTGTFFQFITSIDDKYHHVMCVGHNPTISYLAEYLTKAEINEILPAGMAIIQFNIDAWKEVRDGNGELIKYLDGKNLS